MTREAVDLLVHGRTVVRGVSPDGQPDLVDDGALVARDGEIVAVGRREDLVLRYAAERVIGSPKHVVLPGLVNSHHHVGLTPLQLGTPDLPLEQWVIHRNGARDVDVRLDTLYSAFEMIGSGVTTVQHLHGRAPGPIENAFEVACRIVDAYVEIGMRVSYAFMLRDQNRIAHEPDEVFLKRLPSDLAERMRTYLAGQSFTVDEYFWLIDQLRTRYASEPLVRIQLAPANLHWCSDEALERIADYAARHNLPFHMHLLETRFQSQYARNRTGGTAVEHLDRMGLLSPRCTLGHATWVSEGDIDILADRNVHICHNCSSNLRLRSGIAPLNAMRRRRLAIGLGLDEAGINDDRDMLQEMRLVLRLHRVPGIEPRDVPTPAEVLRMASEGGASTTGFDRIGRLDPGRAADLFLVDYASLSEPYLDERVEVVDAVVQRAKAGMVSAVLVSGKLVYDNGRFTLVDRGDTFAALSDSLRRPLSEAEASRRDLAMKVLPYVTGFYESYPGL